MLAKIPWQPTKRQLQQFGVCAVPALPLFGWLVIGRTPPALWTGADAVCFSMFAASGVLAGLLAWLAPRALRIPFLTATLITLPIGFVVGELLLLGIYFGMFTPIALVFRLIGRDVLGRRFDAATPTYWGPRTKPAGLEQYFRQS